MRLIIPVRGDVTPRGRDEGGDERRRDERGRDEAVSRVHEPGPAGVRVGWRDKGGSGPYGGVEAADTGGVTGAKGG